MFCKGGGKSLSIADADGVDQQLSERDDLPKALADLLVAAKANLPCWVTGRRPSPRR
jgi:hypothetical protein